MKKNVLLLVLGLFLVASCETTSGVGDGTGAQGYTGDGSRSSLQDYLINEVGDRVYFETDKHNINSSSAFKLETQANWIKSTPGFTIILEGHCDERGTREYNLALGKRRAEAVRDYLYLNGISKDRISVKSYGEERPAVTGQNERSYARNRRVEIN